MFLYGISFAVMVIMMNISLCPSIGQATVVNLNTSLFQTKLLHRNDETFKLSVMGNDISRLVEPGMQGTLSIENEPSYHIIINRVEPWGNRLVIDCEKK